MNDFLWVLRVLFNNFPLIRYLNRQETPLAITLNHPLTPVHLWLIVGIALCSIELVLPTAFVTFIMGLSAIVVSILALFVPSIPLQLLVWLFLSTTSIILSRRWLTPKRKGIRIRDDHEGKTLTDIRAGQAGRVFYEGNSWRAVCADDQVTIKAEQPVYIVKQKGTTLIVLPKDIAFFPSQD